MVRDSLPRLRKAGSLHFLPELLTTIDSIAGKASKDDFEFKGVIIDLTLVMDVLHAVGRSLKTAIDQFLHEYALVHGQPVAPFSIQEDYLATYGKLTSVQRIQRCLEAREIDVAFGSPSDDASLKTVCGLDAAYRAQLMHLMGQGIGRKEQAVGILQKLKAHGCHLAAWYNGHHGKGLLRSARLHSLFDCVVDGAVVEKFALRQPPEPDIVLKCCTDMGVSPYECVLLAAHGYHGCAAGASANLGLVLGCHNELVPVEPARQEDELYREGADLVVDISELTSETIAELYSQNITEDPWRLSYRAFLPSDERLREAMTSIGNGYMGNRAAWEGAQIGPVHYPATYLAAVFDKAPSEVKGRIVYNSDMVNLPNWCLIELRIGDGPWVSPFDAGMEVQAYTHFLDMKHACLERSITFKDPEGRVTTVQAVRFVSMHTYHTCAVQYTVTPLNYSAPLTLRSSIDGDVMNDNVGRYSDLTRVHLTDYTTSDHKGCNGISLQCRTIYTDVGLALFAKHTLWEDSVEQPQAALVSRQEKAISAEYTVQAEKGRSYTVEKLVSIFSSLDAEFVAAPDCTDRAACLGRLAREALQDVQYFAQLLEPHKRAWAEMWDKSDMVVDGDRFAQTMIRVHTYHLLVTASPHRTLVDAGLPARGLCGEGYRGHVFWDEVYMFPFYLSKFPEVAKAHLQYRARRLPQAKQYATASGLRGAMYPWQTSDTGEEESQVVHYNPVSGLWDPDGSCRQRHVSITIFLDAWRYWHATRDKEFLESSLAEMMLEIAMFWHSITTFDPADEKYHISGVMGPDEFHECSKECGHGVKDNAYTNIMVVWVFQKVKELLTELSPAAGQRIRDGVGLTDRVLQSMDDMSRKMCVEVRGGIMQQFAGFGDLQELNWSLYRKKYKSIRRIDRILKAEGLVPDEYKVCKQPDFLMVYYLLAPHEVSTILQRLGVPVDDDIAFLRRNYDYYLARTSHGSTLSFTVMAKVAQMCGQADYEWEWFLEAAKSDIYDLQGTTHEGIHCAVMAGTLDIIVSNFVGLRENLDGSYCVWPSLPKHWQSVSFKQLLRGQWYELLVTKKDVRITLTDGFSSDTATGPFFIGNNKIMLCPWSPITVEYNTIVSFKNFFDLLLRTKFVRQSIVDAYLDGAEPAHASLAVLRHALQALTGAPKGEGGLAQLLLARRHRVLVDMAAEARALHSDLVLLLRGEEALLDYLAQQPGNEGFKQLVADAAKFLAGPRYRNFITARDGTTAVLCGRYATGVQAVYNAVFLATFARHCATHSIFLTAAPLHALRGVTVLPDGLFSYCCSRGREVLTHHGLYHGVELPPEQHRLLDGFHRRMQQLLALPENEKFAFIGSGLQLKMAQVTVARQDTGRTIPPEDSDAFLEAVRQVAQDAGGGRLLVAASDLDIDVTVVDTPATPPWTKGDGLVLADQHLSLGLSRGPNLVCGDSWDDLSMLEVAMRWCPLATRCVFVTADPALQEAARRACPRCLFVPTPDVLVAALYRTARPVPPAPMAA